MIGIKKVCTSADACVQTTIQDCLENGDFIETSKDKSYEILHYQTGLDNPAARIMTNRARPLNIVVAVARLVWLMSGNDRLEDIAFYEPKVSGFTDNGLTVPGSCYGARLFNSQPGINQIEGVIDRLITDPESRQASAVVWQPHDAVRLSKDIPCTHGMFFHIRDGRLEMAVTMRSNNAFRILPFNIFEFTMLHEYVAARLQLPMGDYVHWAASMHVYDNEFETPPTKELAYSNPSDSIIMPPMPTDDVREQMHLLCVMEAKLRHSGSGIELDELNRMAADLLQPYWLDLFKVLFCYVVAKRHCSAETYFNFDPLAQLVLNAINKTKGK